MVRYGSKLRYGTKFFRLKVRFEITVRYIFPGTVWPGTVRKYDIFFVL